MSTNLELCQPEDFQKIRVPAAIRITGPLQSSCIEGDNEIIIIAAAEDDDTVIHQLQGNSDVECKTPTSKEHKIPTILSCPPAPRKPKRGATISCKRKLSELDFFDVVNREEVDSFFRSSFDGLLYLQKRSRCPIKAAYSD